MYACTVEAEVVEFGVDPVPAVVVVEVPVVGGVG